MDNFLNITLGTIPLGAIVVVIGLLNRQAIKHLNHRVGQLEEGFNNHLKYHIKKGGDNS